MGSKAFENPLISHARMRAMYRGLLEVRQLATSMSKSARLPRGLEACWVGTAIDLKPGDLTSDTNGNALLDYIRAIGQRLTAGPGRPAEARKLIADPAIAFAGSPSDRLLCAAGAAMAIKAARQNSVVLAYVMAAEMRSADWRRVLTIAACERLPLVIVAAGASVPVVKGFHLPVIPVDAADAVAIYRVTQECILRGRDDGSAAVIACVPTGADPIKILASQLLAKRIATPRWILSCEQQLRRIQRN